MTQKTPAFYNTVQINIISKIFVTADGKHEYKNIVTKIAALRSDFSKGSKARTEILKNLQSHLITYKYIFKGNLV